MFIRKESKFNLLIWMGIGSALLSSIFSTIIITIICNNNKRIRNQIS